MFKSCVGGSLAVKKKVNTFKSGVEANERQVPESVFPQNVSSSDLVLLTGRFPKAVRSRYSGSTNIFRVIAKPVSADLQSVLFIEENFSGVSNA